MPTFTDFQQENIGFYKHGRFYSWSFSGEPYELDLMHLRGVGRESCTTQFGKVSGGLQKTMRLIVLLHETSHLVHDLSLGMCLDYDYVLDQSNAVLIAAVRELSSKGTIRCPLLSSDNRYQWLHDAELHQKFTEIEIMENALHRLLIHPPDLASYCVNLSPAFSRSQSNLEVLSGLSLLEGLVAAKTLTALTDRVEDEADVRYLQENKDSLPILLETLPEVYSVARRVYDETIGVRLFNGATFLDDQLPRNHLQPPSLSEIGFVYIADIALHIPPSELTVKRIDIGRNAAEDFIPAYRFCKAIASIVRNGCFPPGDILNPGRYYNQLYDFFASDKELRWPTINETNSAWKLKLALFKKARREAADGYRFRMLVERDQKPHSIVMGDPLIACGRQFIPVFHLTPNMFKTLQSYMVENRWYVAPFEIPDMAADKFFWKDYELWKDIPAPGSLKDLAGESDNQLLFRQEIVYRSLCRELYSAMLYKHSFSCPFAQGGCSVAVAGCQEITHLDDIPKSNCCLRGYLNQDKLMPSRIMWL
jgi:hypothetical protein